MKVLVIGAEGQLGADLCREFQADTLHRADLDGTGYPLDIRDRAETLRLLGALRPDVVVNAAAAHNVPKCEEDPALAFSVNALGTRHLAEACREIGARLLHISTDYVFDGAKRTPYLESDLPAPLNVYGVSKLAGEQLLAAVWENHIIVRTAALYGAAPCRAKGGRNFVSMMLELAATRSEVRAVTDEITTPTSTAALAKQIRRLALEGEPGLYHATCQGGCSWHEFTQVLFAARGIQTPLLPAVSADFPSAVRKPAYSVLENSHAKRQGLDIMPAWEEALRDYLSALS